MQLWRTVLRVKFSARRRIFPVDRWRARGAGAALIAS
jgi:hypothetical protein